LGGRCAASKENIDAEKKTHTTKSRHQASMSSPPDETNTSLDSTNAPKSTIVGAAPSWVDLLFAAAGVPTEELNRPITPEFQNVLANLWQSPLMLQAFQQMCKDNPRSANRFDGATPLGTDTDTADVKAYAEKAIQTGGNVCRAGLAQSTTLLDLLRFTTNPANYRNESQGQAESDAALATHALAQSPNPTSSSSDADIYS